MPLLRRLDYVNQGGLDVAFRASDARQELRIDVMTTGTPFKGTANWYFRNLLDIINEGGAGGATFAPTAGFAEMVSGPITDNDAKRPDHHAVFNVAGVDPLFVRTIVEDLRFSGLTEPVTHLSIVGSIPLDATPMAIHSQHVRAWLDDPHAYPGAWPSPGFPLAFDEISEGASIRVVLGAPITPELRARLEHLAGRWLCAVRNYVDDDGEEKELDALHILPRMAQAKTEFRAHYTAFPFAREPSRAMVTNLLSRFHHSVASIEEAEVTL